MSWIQTHTPKFFRFLRTKLLYRYICDNVITFIRRVRNYIEFLQLWIINWFTKANLFKLIKPWHTCLFIIREMRIIYVSDSNYLLFPAQLQCRSYNSPILTRKCTRQSNGVEMIVSIFQSRSVLLNQFKLKITEYNQGRWEGLRFGVYILQMLIFMFVYYYIGPAYRLSKVRPYC